MYGNSPARSSNGPPAGLSTSQQAPLPPSQQQQQHSNDQERHQNCWVDSVKQPDQKILIWIVFIHHHEGQEHNTMMMGMVQQVVVGIVRKIRDGVVTNVEE